MGWDRPDNDRHRINTQPTLDAYGRVLPSRQLYPHGFEQVRNPPVVYSFWNRDPLPSSVHCLHGRTR